MNTLESVKFQGSESDSNSMDSASVNIKIPEIDISLQPSAQNGKKTKENEHEILKTGTRNWWLKLVFVIRCCLAFVCFMIAIGGPIYLGFYGKSNGVKCFRRPIFGHRNSSQLEIGHNFQPRAEVLEQENPNPDAETAETGSEQVDMIELVETLFDDIKEVTSKISDEVSQLGNDPRGQITALGQNGSREVNSLGEELKMEISLLKDQMMTQSLNFSKNSSAPPSSPSNPRFYQNDNYKDAWFEASPGWEKKCVDMPAYFDKMASSFNPGVHCVLVCPEKSCEDKQGTRGVSVGKECVELHQNSYGLDNLSKIGYNKTIRSFRLCQTIYWRIR